MLFYVKKKLLTYKYKNRADCMNGNVHVCLHALAIFNPKNGELYSFFSYSGGGLQWFAVVCGGLPASSLVSLPMPQILVVICGGLR